MTAYVIGSIDTAAYYEGLAYPRNGRGTFTPEIKNAERFDSMTIASMTIAVLTASDPCAFALNLIVIPVAHNPVMKPRDPQPDLFPYL